MAKKSKVVVLPDEAPAGFAWYSSTGECTSARGQKFDPPKTFPYKWMSYAPDQSGIDAMVKANDTLSLEDQRKVVVDSKGLTERQKALDKMLDDAGIVKPTAANDDQLKLKAAFDVLMLKKNADGSPKFTVEAARVKAAEFLEIDWEE